MDVGPYLQEKPANVDTCIGICAYLHLEMQTQPCALSQETYIAMCLYTCANTHKHRFNDVYHIEMCRNKYIYICIYICPMYVIYIYIHTHTYMYIYIYVGVCGVLA